MGIKTRTNDLGFLEGFDEESGEVVWVEKRKTVVKNGKVERASSPGRGRPKKVDTDTHHYVLDGRGEKLWVPKGTDPTNLPKVAWPFNPVTADHVCRMVTEGLTLKKIGETEGMPPAHVIHGWKRKYPEFSRELDQAIRDRAVHFADRVLEFADSTNKDTVFEDRLKTELLKWGAEQGNPEAFGKKKAPEGTASPVQIVIVTGVPQKDEEPPAIEVKGEPLADLPV